MTDLTYVSLFSGIEAFSVAASRVEGVRWHPVFFSEIEPFPCAVLAHHFPNVPNLGDICKIRIDHANNTATNGTTTVALPRTGIDILAGGSPCQDVSVAGKRAGMSEGSGTRSSLAFEYARLVRELRPRVLLWENVPGVLSSNGGRDFTAFLHTLDELGYSLAWRVLDCQYTRVDSAPMAVPQRRRRVWLVGCLGGDGRVPAQILFERAGVLGDTPPRREAGQGFAAPAGYGPARNDRVVECAGFGETGQGFWQPGVQTLRADHQGVNWPSNVAVTPCGTGAGGDSGGRGDDAGEGSGTGGSLEVAAPLCAADGKGKNGMDICGKVAVVPTDCLTPGHPQTHRVYRADGAAYTLNAGERSGQDQRAVLVESASFDGADVSATLHKPNGTPGYSDQEVFAQQVAYLARVAVPAPATFGKTGHAMNAEGEGEKYAPVDVAQTLNTFQNQSDARAVDLVVAPSVCKTLSAEGFDGMPDVQKGNGQPIATIGFCPEESSKTRSIGAHDETSPTLNSSSIRATAIGFKPGQSGREDTGSLGARMEESPTLLRDPGGMGVGVAVGFSHVASGAILDCQPKPCATPLKRSPGGEGGAVAIIPAPGLSYIVRRLTPVECERLQGFPDGWTRIPWRMYQESVRKKISYERLLAERGMKLREPTTEECPDSPRYKALGNSWATNCAEWILRRIVAAIRLGMVAPNGGPRP